MAIVTEIVISPRSDDLEEIQHRLGNTTSVRHAITDTLTESARAGEHFIEIEAPNGRTHSLKDAIDHTPARTRPDGSIEARAGVGEVPTARGSRRFPYDVHEGTGLYGKFKRRIYATGPWPMKIPFATGVAHVMWTKGQRPNPFVERALPEVEEYVEQRLPLMVRRIIGE
jgi:hypothetical protein